MKTPDIHLDGISVRTHKVLAESLPDISVGDMRWIIEEAVFQAAHALRRGETVHLDELGTFARIKRDDGNPIMRFRADLGLLKAPEGIVSRIMGGGSYGTQPTKTDHREKLSDPLRPAVGEPE